MAPTANVNLQGWDVVNAATFEAVNKAIVSSATTPKTFAISAVGALKLDMNGTWSPWKLVEGSAGETLAVALPVNAGTVSYDMPPFVYATLDPATKGAVTLDAAKLTVSSAVTAMAQESAFGTIGAKSGKRYFEVTNPNTGILAAGKVVYAGVGPNINAGQTFTIGASGYGYGVNGKLRSNNANGQVAGPNNTMVDAAGWDAPGATIGVAVDLDAGTLWFRGPDGTWQGAGADPANGTGAAFSNISKVADLYPAVSIGPGLSLTVNFGASPFKHALPPGFAGWMQLPTRTTVKLDGASVLGTIRLAKVPGSGNQVKLVPDAAGTANNPAATVTQVVLIGGTAADSPVVDAFDTWLKANIGTFTNVFHTIEISDQTAIANPKNAALAWMLPTGFAYAATDLPGATPTKSALAILTETGMNPTGNLAAQVPANILASLPAAANSVVAISAEKLVQKILLPGLVSMFANTTAADFAIDMLGTSVSNVNPLKYGQMTLKDGTIVNPDVPPGGIRATIDGRKIAVAFDQLSFNYPGATFGLGETVTFGFRQSFYLTLTKRADNLHVLYPSFKNPDDPKDTGEARVDDLTISYVLSKSANGATLGLLITGIILSVLTIGTFAGGAAGYKLAGTAFDGAANNAASNIAAQGNAVGNYGRVAMVQAPGVYMGVSDAMEGDVAMVIVEVDQGGNALVPAATPVDGGSSMPFIAKHAFGITMLGVFGGFLTAADWAAFGIAASTAQAFAKGSFDGVSAEATLEKFTGKMLAPFAWPDSKTWTLVDARLNGSLMIYGTLA